MLASGALAASIGTRAQTVDPDEAYARAAAFFDRAEYREALTAFDDVLRTADDALARRAREGKVRTALRVAEFDLALREAEVLIGGTAVDAATHVLHGDALWGTGLFDEAESAYRTAVRLDPASARGRMGLARSLASRSLLDEALGEALAATALAPDDPEMHAVTGSVYERLLRFQDAAVGYEAYAARLPAGEAVAMTTSRARALFLRSFKDRLPFAMRPRDVERAHRISFKLIKNKIVVQGRVNGAAVDFVVDTGAERTALSAETARRGGVRPVAVTLTAGVGPPWWRRVGLARLERLEIGSLRMRDVPVSIRPAAPRGAPRWLGETLSPLALGLSVQVDYQTRHLTLAHRLPEESADVTLPLRLHRLPLVRGQVNGARVMSFVVDTGGEMMSLSSDAARALGPLPERRIALRVFGLTGLDETAFLLPGMDLAIDVLRYPKIGLAVLDLRAPSVLLGFQVGGILGHRFLADYGVTLDVARSQLRLVRRSPAQKS
jgi:Flp pilus assembly protein TadD